MNRYCKEIVGRKPAHKHTLLSLLHPAVHLCLMITYAHTLTLPLLPSDRSIQRRSREKRKQRKLGKTTVYMWQFDCLLGKWKPELQKVKVDVFSVLFEWGLKLDQIWKTMQELICGFTMVTGLWQHRYMARFGETLSLRDRTCCFRGESKE